MIANLISLSRLPLLYVTLYFISFDSLKFHEWALALTLLIMILDAFDGMAARYFHEETEFGTVFDIVIDRIVENCYWIFFAARGVIPVAIPIIIITRGILTDGIRSVALAKGMTAFGERTMQRTSLGRLIVVSRFSRGLVNTLKILSFLVLILLDALHLPDIGGIIQPNYHELLRVVGNWTVYVTVAFCVIRGLPVIIESRPLLFPRNFNAE
jgi:CDP-diacylglycerol--glycerol-3-phosphate 3-phosphatidyltransferase